MLYRYIFTFVVKTVPVKRKAATAMRRQKQVGLCNLIVSNSEVRDI
jgi:hypothetical protein